MNILNRSGDRGCPCSVPRLMFMCEVSRKETFMHAVELLYISERQSKKCPEMQIVGVISAK